MTVYNLAEAKNGLPRLIDRALDGEEVIISRHGRPVAELRPIQAPAKSGEGPDPSDAYGWLRMRRNARAGVGVTAVELLDEVYGECR